MGKSTLTLSGAHDAWSRSVRRGTLVRPNGGAAPVLVRVDHGQDATPQILEALRDDARLLARVQHESVLRLEHVTSVGGRVAFVHEACEAASLAFVARTLGDAGRSVPVRAAVEIAAAVALALDEALRVVDEDGRRVQHPGPDLEDVLVDVSGRVRVAGFVVRRVADGAGAVDATLSVARLLAALLGSPSAPELLERLAVGRRSRSAVQDRLQRAVTAALGADPALRGPPGAFGRVLREDAVSLSGEGVRAWAPSVIAAGIGGFTGVSPGPDGVSVVDPVPAQPSPAGDNGSRPSAVDEAPSSRPGPPPRTLPAALSVLRLRTEAQRTDQARLRPGLPNPPQPIQTGDPTVPTDPPEDRPTRVSGGARQTVTPPTNRSAPPAPQRGLSARTGPSLDLLVSGEDDEEEATVIGIARPLDLTPAAPKADLFAMDELGARPSAASAAAPVARATSVFDDEARPVQTSIRAQPRGSGSMGTVIALVIGLVLLGAAALAYALLRSDDAPQAPAATSP